jgi:tetratricopeptide (TPR) repeat protein
MEELYLTALHIEQYRHATYLPDPYYLEGLKRDPGDIRINTAYGMLLMRRGCYGEAERCFRKALKRLTWKNPNPYNSEAYYNLGLVLMYQGKDKEAYDAFYKATWSNEQQEMSFYYLAALDAKKGDYTSALELINKGLIKNAHNIKARGLKAAILRKLSKIAEAENFIAESLQIDPFDYVSMFELYLITKTKNENTLKDEIDQKKDGLINSAFILNEVSILDKMTSLMRNFHENYLQAARDYAEAGFYEEAIQMLGVCSQDKPMLKYYEGFYYGKLQKNEKAVQSIKEAEEKSSDYCFPNKFEDIAVLSYASQINPEGARAYYYLGNLYYDKLQFDKAIKLWEISSEIDGYFAITLRNLALAYYNKLGDSTKARTYLEKAYDLDKTDARIFLELDQLYKKLDMSHQFRLDRYNQHKEVFIDRDDLFIEYITLHNLLGRHEEAYQLIMQRRFHPWEGGEGKITTQYTTALVEMAKARLDAKDYSAAKDYLEKALVYPENIGEGKLEGTKDNHILYYLGCAMEGLNDQEKAKAYYTLAAVGTEEPAGMMYYNDQPADMILYQGLANLKLSKTKEAKSRFYKLVDYGEKHIFDHVKIEYFAVSLPDFLIFNEDLNKRNKTHCYYLLGLGNLGLGHGEKAKEYFEKAVALDHCHMNGILYKKSIDFINQIRE